VIVKWKNSDKIEDNSGDTNILGTGPYSISQTDFDNATEACPRGGSRQ